MHYLSKGKRGIVYVDVEGGRRVVIKKKRSESAAVGALENEARWLRILNKYGIGPKFIRSGEGMVVMEYIEGAPFVEWHEKHAAKERRKVTREIFQQCRIMDNLHVNKLEMHTPLKHIIVRRGKPILIDFERCKLTLKPKNVTQFCQFLLTLGYDVDRVKLRKLLGEYKESYNKDTFEKIVRLFVG